MDLDIETLVCLNHGPWKDREESIQQLLNHQLVEDNVFPSKSAGELELENVTTESDNEESVNESLLVRGSDIGDLPTEYEVVGLQPDEMPVIGTYIDSRITIGFTYRVRRLGNSTMLFSGKPVTLEKIGLGYGKRITFSGEGMNSPSNYFFSDSYPEGFGFSLVAVESSDKFSIISSADDHPMGTAEIEQVTFQRELLSQVTSQGQVEKNVAVAMVCRVSYCAQPNRFLPIWGKDCLDVTGVVTLQKPRKSKRARLVSIEQLELPHLGSCILKPLPKIA